MRNSVDVVAHGAVPKVEAGGYAHHRYLTLRWPDLSMIISLEDAGELANLLNNEVMGWMAEDDPMREERGAYEPTF